MYPPMPFYPSIGATLIYAVLLAIIVKRGITRAGNMSVFLFFLAALIWSAAEAMERITPLGEEHHSLAMLSGMFIFTGMALLGSSILHFSWDYPTRFMPEKPELRSYVLYTVYGIAIIAVLINFISTPLTIKDMDPYVALGDKVWGIIPGPLYKIYVLYMYILSIISAVILVFKALKEKVAVVRMQALYVSIGIIIALVLLSGTGLIPILLDISDIYPLTTPSFIILGLIIIYLTFRYRAFLPEKSTGGESTWQDRGLIELPEKKAYDTFLEAVSSGAPGLVFTPKDREKFIAENSLEGVLVFELSDKTAQETISPAIDEMRSMIPFITMTFAEENNGVVVLLHYRKQVKSVAGDEALEALEKELSSVFSTHRGTFIVVKE